VGRTNSQGIIMLVSRRDMLKAATIGTLASFFPRMVHSATGVSHPTWDHLLEYIGCGLGDQRPMLRGWIYDLVYCPDQAQATMSLSAPENGTKAIFPAAMEILLPGKVVRSSNFIVSEYTYSTKRGHLNNVKETSTLDWQKLNAALVDARLMVVDKSHWELKGYTFRRWSGHRLKWCFVVPEPAVSQITCNPFTSVVRLVPKRMPTTNLLKGLMEERDAFLQTLSRMPSRTAIVRDESSPFNSQYHGQFYANFEDYRRDKNKHFADLYGGSLKFIHS
jgi:hypothetical protein